MLGLKGLRKLTEQYSLPGSPSAGMTLLCDPNLPEDKNARQDIIFSSAFPALNGGLMDGVADCGLRDGDKDLDLSTTLPLFSGRRGHSHTQWNSLE